MGAHLENVSLMTGRHAWENNSRRGTPALANAKIAVSTHHYDPQRNRREQSGYKWLVLEKISGWTVDLIGI
jgi:hypothetical protein